jgi:serine/threonine protein kinase
MRKVRWAPAHQQPRARSRAPRASADRRRAVCAQSTQWRATSVAVKILTDQSMSDEALKEFRTEVTMMSKMRHPNVVLLMGICARPTAPPRAALRSRLRLTDERPRALSDTRLHAAQPRNRDGVPRAWLSLPAAAPHRGPRSSTTAAPSAVVLGLGRSHTRVCARWSCQTPLDDRRRVKMGIDIAKGMAYLHSADPPIVHRDLKSPNLLVDETFTVRLSTICTTLSALLPSFSPCLLVGCCIRLADSSSSRLVRAGEDLRLRFGSVQAGHFCRHRQRLRRHSELHGSGGTALAVHHTQ